MATLSFPTSLTSRFGATLLALPLVGWALPLDMETFRAFATAPALEPIEVVQVDVPEAVPLDVETVTERLQARYDTIEDLQANFSQESINNALGETRTSAGQVYFRRPGAMLWDYEDGRRLILNDDAMHSIDQDLQQYYSAPIDRSDLPTAMRFLVGEGELADDFTITLADDDDPHRVALELEPIVPSSEYASLLFVIDTETYYVVETHIADAIGNVNIIRFDDVETNLGISADAFAFSPPAGFTRVEVPQ